MLIYLMSFQILQMALLLSSTMGTLPYFLSRLKLAFEVILSFANIELTTQADLLCRTMYTKAGFAGDDGPRVVFREFACV